MNLKKRFILKKFVNLYVYFVYIFRWYQGFDWEGLEARTLTPPIIPKVRKY